MRKLFIVSAVFAVLATSVLAKSWKPRGGSLFDEEDEEEQPGPVLPKSPLVIMGTPNSPGYKMYGPTYSFGGKDVYVIRPPELVYDPKTMDSQQEHGQDDHHDQQPMMMMMRSGNNPGFSSLYNHGYGKSSGYVKKMVKRSADSGSPSAIDASSDIVDFDTSAVDPVDAVALLESPLDTFGPVRSHGHRAKRWLKKLAKFVKPGKEPAPVAPPPAPVPVPVPAPAPVPVPIATTPAPVKSLVYPPLRLPYLYPNYYQPQPQFNYNRYSPRPLSSPQPQQQYPQNQQYQPNSPVYRQPYQRPAQSPYQNQYPQVPSLPQLPSLPNLARLPKIPRIPTFSTYSAPGVPRIPQIPRIPKYGQPNYPAYSAPAPTASPQPPIPSIPPTPEIPAIPELPELPDFLFDQQLPELPKLPAYPELPPNPPRFEYDYKYDGKNAHAEYVDDENTPNFIIYLPPEPPAIEGLNDNEYSAPKQPETPENPSSQKEGEGAMSVYEYGQNPSQSESKSPKESQQNEYQQQNNNLDQYNIHSVPNLPIHEPIIPLQPETPLQPLPLDLDQVSTSDSAYPANAKENEGAVAANANNNYQPPSYNNNGANAPKVAGKIVPSYAAETSINDYKPVASLEDVYNMAGSNNKPIVVSAFPHPQLERMVDVVNASTSAFDSAPYININTNNKAEDSRVDNVNHDTYADNYNNSQNNSQVQTVGKPNDEEFVKNMDAYENFLKNSEITNKQKLDKESDNSNRGTEMFEVGQDEEYYQPPGQSQVQNRNADAYNNNNNNAPSYIKSMSFDTPSGNTSYRIGLYSQSNGGSGPSSAFAAISPKKIMVYASTPKNPGQVEGYRFPQPPPPPPPAFYYQNRQENPHQMVMMMQHPQPQPQHQIQLQPQPLQLQQQPMSMPLPMPMPVQMSMGLPMSMMGPAQLMGPNGFNLGMLGGAAPGQGDANVAMGYLETLDGKEEEEEEDRKRKNMRKA